VVNFDGRLVPYYNECCRVDIFQQIICALCMYMANELHYEYVGTSLSECVGTIRIRPLYCELGFVPEAKFNGIQSSVDSWFTVRISVLVGLYRSRIGLMTQIEGNIPLIRRF